MNFKHVLIPFVLAVSALVAAPEAFAANSYEVTATIQQNGETVGEPTVVVRPDVLATVQLHGEQGYAMDVTVLPVEGNLLQVTVKVETSQGFVSTALTTSAGKPIVVASGDLDLALTVTEAGT